MSTERYMRLKDDCEGTTAKELIRDLYRWKQRDQKLDYLIIKGHGVPEFGIVDDDDKWLIVVDSPRGVHIGGAIDGDFGSDVTMLLKQLIDKDTHIILRGCKTSEAARRLSAILEVKVTGYRGLGPEWFQFPFTVNIPYSDAVIGIPVTYEEF